MGQITPKLLAPLFWINFRLPVRTVFPWTDANGCAAASEAGADRISRRVGCAGEVARESGRKEGGGGKVGRRGKA